VHRLTSALQINDAQARMSKADRTFRKDVAVIRTSIPDHSDHSAKKFRSDSFTVQV
jgi:hypothetical protein